LSQRHRRHAIVHQQPRGVAAQRFVL
jgi:hypothetical protein